MELPNDSTNECDTELDMMCLETAVNILIELAEAGDDEARQTLIRACNDADACLKEIRRRKQKQEGSDA